MKIRMKIKGVRCPNSSEVSGSRRQERKRERARGCKFISTNKGQKKPMIHKKNRERKTVIALIIKSKIGADKESAEIERAQSIE